MLKNLTIEGYKPFREKQEFRLAPLTLIYGPNSAGKSSLLEAIRLLLAQRDQSEKDPEGFIDLRGSKIHSIRNEEDVSSDKLLHLKIEGDFISKVYFEKGYESVILANKLIATSDLLANEKLYQLNKLDREFDRYIPGASERFKARSKKLEILYGIDERECSQEEKNKIAIEEIKRLYGFCEQHQYIDQWEETGEEWPDDDESPWTKPLNEPFDYEYLEPIEKELLNPIWKNSEYWCSETTQQCFEIDKPEFVAMISALFCHPIIAKERSYREEIKRCIEDLSCVFFNQESQAYFLPERTRDGEVISDRAVRVWSLVNMLVDWKNYSDKEFTGFEQIINIVSPKVFNIDLLAPLVLYKIRDVSLFNLFSHFALPKTKIRGVRSFTSEIDFVDVLLAAFLSFVLPFGAVYSRDRLITSRSGAFKYLARNHFGKVRNHIALLDTDHEGGGLVPGSLPHKIAKSTVGGFTGSLISRSDIRRTNDRIPVSHVPPIRPEPKRLYPKDEFFNSVFSYLIQQPNGDVSFGSDDILTGFGAGKLKNLSRDLKRLNLNYRCRVRLSNPPYFGKHILLELQDKSNEGDDKSWVTLDNVGSGVAQVFPVINELQKSQEIGLSIVQQPELHLHPRQQADLGEMIAKTASNGARQYICETHSELIVRRIQRMIRRGDLKPEDVCVLYVNPLDGHSSIEELRLDDEGEFMDIWPNGFFAESLGEVLAEDSEVDENKAESSDE